MQDKPEHMTRQEMKDGADTVMTLLSVLGMFTVLIFVVSELLILWLVSPTRVTGSVLVTVDVTFINGGIVVCIAGGHAAILLRPSLIGWLHIDQSASILLRPSLLGDCNVDRSASGIMTQISHPLMFRS